MEKELTQKCIQNYDAESDKKKNNELSQAYTEDTQWLWTDAKKVHKLIEFNQEA